MTISLWFCAWTPYLVINYGGIFELINLTPMFTVWGSVFAKANAVYNPIVYGIRYIIFSFRKKIIFVFSVIQNTDKRLKKNFRSSCVDRHQTKHQQETLYPQVAKLPKEVKKRLEPEFKYNRILSVINSWWSLLRNNKWLKFCSCLRE